MSADAFTAEVHALRTEMKGYDAENKAEIDKINVLLLGEPSDKDDNGLKGDVKDVKDSVEDIHKWVRRGVVGLIGLALAVGSEHSPQVVQAFIQAIKAMQ